MAAQENAVGLHGGDGTSGVYGGVALDEYHPGHIAGFELRVIRTRGGGATLRGDETITLELRRKLPQRGSLKTRKDQRRFDGFQSGARWQDDLWRCEIIRSVGKGVVWQGRRRELLN